MPIVDLQDFVREAWDGYSKIGVGDDAPYEECIAHREIWDDLSGIEESSVKTIVLPFLNKWQCRLPYECVPQLTATLRDIEERLEPLRRLNIARADLLKPTTDSGEPIIILIDEIAEQICQVKAGKRTVGFTATSKILHMCVPEFFVMSDDVIRQMYGCEGNGRGYGNFMLRMNILAIDLVAQANGNVDMICGYKGSKKRLTKLLDQYNYTKSRNLSR